MAWYAPITQLNEAERTKGLKDLYYEGLCWHCSARSPTYISSGLNMGMRRMTAFPHEMLRKTSRSTSSTLNRVTRRKPDP